MFVTSIIIKYNIFCVIESRGDHPKWAHNQIQIDWAAKNGHLLGYWCDPCGWSTIARSWGGCTSCFVSDNNYQ